MKRRGYLRRSGIVGGAALTSALAGCTGSGGDDDSITVYTNIPFEEIVDGYEAVSDTEVEYITLGGAQPVSRYVGEWEQDQHEADIIVCFDGSMWPLIERDIPMELDFMDQSMVDELFHFEGQEETIRERLGDDIPERAPPFIAQIGAHHYHEENVDDPPVTFGDVVDERFEDRVITQPQIMNYVWWLLSEEWGEDAADEWILDFEDLNPEYLIGGGGQIESLVGEENDVSMFTWAFYSAQARSNGSPISVEFPDLIGYGTEVALVSRDAPNPEPAQEFVEWLVSDDGQDVVQTLNGGSLPQKRGYEYGDDHVQEKWEAAQDRVTMIPIVDNAEMASRSNQRIEELIGLELDS